LASLIIFFLRLVKVVETYIVQEEWEFPFHAASVTSLKDGDLQFASQFVVLKWTSFPWKM
jgi:hypothetical protein